MLFTSPPPLSRRALLLAGAAWPFIPATAQNAPSPSAQGAQPQRLSLRELTHDALLPTLGNPQGDVTIVKFSDFQCAYCKRSYTNLQALLEQDAKLRVVIRDLFVYGESSRHAARMALASAQQGRYAQVVKALFSHSGRLNEERVEALLTAQGVNVPAANQWVASQRDRLDALFDRNVELARTLGFRGTPSYVIGRVTVPGGIPQEKMRELVAQARTELAAR